MTRIIQFCFSRNCRYVTEACSFAFQCFYDDVGGGIEAMGDFWKLVAVTYQNHSNILG